MNILVEVCGMKAFKGTIDGKSIDSGTLFARVKLDARNNKVGEHELNFKAGEAVEEWRMPNAAAVMSISHQQVPFVCSLEVERVSNGRETKDVVVGCTVSSQNARPAPEPLKKAA
jgi:hypothetical protein